MNIAEQYISDVLDGTVVAGQLLIKAFKRHREDLEHAHERGFHFDPSAGLRVIEFIESFCIPAGSEVPLKLMPWQHAILYVTYGWLRQNGTRRFRRALVEVAKKSGKTELAAALCLNHLVADNEMSARCFIAATTRKQAQWCFKAAVQQRDNNPELKSLIQKSGNEPVLALYIAETGSRLSAMSRDADTSDGALVSFAVLDELHRWPANSGLYSVLRYGGRTRPQPLMFEITTAGSSAGGTTLCWQEHEYCQKILDKIVEDDEVATWIFSLDPKDDWRDEKNWGKSNPSLGFLYDLDSMKKEFKETQGKPTAAGEFKRFCLNIWNSESELPAIELSKWDACCREPLENHPDPVRLRAESLAALKGRRVFAGLDLAPKIDTSALVLLFPPETKSEKWRVIPYFWCPADNVEGRVKRDRVPYDVWAEKGFITLTEGNLTDVRFIVDAITEINKQFDLVEICYDDAWSSEAVRMLGEADFPMQKFVSFPQSHLKMNAPCQEWMRKILRQEFAHDADPVMRWQVSNLRWNTQSTTGFIKPDRDSKREKIDGPASMIMALARATDPANQKKKFNFFVVQSKDTPEQAPTPTVESSAAPVAAPAMRVYGVS